LRPTCGTRTVEKFHWLREVFADADLRGRMVDVVENFDGRRPWELMALLAEARPIATQSDQPQQAEATPRTSSMPLISCDMRYGRTDEQKRKLAAGLPRVVSEATGEPYDNIFFVIRERRVINFVEHGENFAEGRGIRPGIAEEKAGLIKGASEVFLNVLNKAPLLVIEGSRWRTGGGAVYGCPNIGAARDPSSRRAVP
jgi:4-oxalocrotonate tautomerase